MKQKYKHIVLWLSSLLMFGFTFPTRTFTVNPYDIEGTQLQFVEQFQLSEDFTQGESALESGPVTIYLNPEEYVIDLISITSISTEDALNLLEILGIYPDYYMIETVYHSPYDPMALAISSDMAVEIVNAHFDDTLQDERLTVNLIFNEAIVEEALSDYQHVIEDIRMNGENMKNNENQTYQPRGRHRQDASISSQHQFDRTPNHPQQGRKRYDGRWEATTSPSQEGNKPNDENAAKEEASSVIQERPMSRIALIDELVYRGFTQSVAETAVDQLNINWYGQALLVAQLYTEHYNLSDEQLKEQLMNNHFTEEEADYVINNLPH